MSADLHLAPSPLHLYRNYINERLQLNSNKCNSFWYFNQICLVSIWSQNIQLICRNRHLVLSLSGGPFSVQLITYCICPNHTIHLFTLQNVFVHVVKYIFPYCKIYFSILQNIFVQIAKSNPALLATFGSSGGPFSLQGISYISHLFGASKGISTQRGEED